MRLPDADLKRSQRWRRPSMMIVLSPRTARSTFLPAPMTRGGSLPRAMDGAAAAGCMDRPWTTRGVAHSAHSSDEVEVGGGFSCLRLWGGQFGHPHGADGDFGPLGGQFGHPQGADGDFGPLGGQFGHPQGADGTYVRIGRRTRQKQGEIPYPPPQRSRGGGAGEQVVTTASYSSPPSRWDSRMRVFLAMPSRMVASFSVGWSFCSICPRATRTCPSFLPFM